MQTKPLLKKGWVVGIILLFIGTAVIPSNGQTIGKTSARGGHWLYVGGSGPGNYTTIQDAVNHASAGDTVYVYQGSYPESVKVNTSLVLLAENQQTIIDGEFLYSPAVAILADTVTMEGFMVLANQTDNGKASIMVLGNNCNILWNRVSTTGSGDIGIGLVSVEGVVVKDNMLTHLTIGVCLVNASHDTVVNNSVVGDQEGVYLYTSNDNVVENNTVKDDVNGISLLDSCGNMIRGNTVWSCSHDGVFLGYVDNGSSFNVVSGNSFNKNGRDALFIVGKGRNTFDGNYWHRYLSVPKVIVGRRVVLTIPGAPFHFPGLKVAIPWVAVDWHPAKNLITSRGYKLTSLYGILAYRSCHFPFRTKNHIVNN